MGTSAARLQTERQANTAADVRPALKEKMKKKLLQSTLVYNTAAPIEKLWTKLIKHTKETERAPPWHCDLPSRAFE